MKPEVFFVPLEDGSSANIQAEAMDEIYGKSGADRIISSMDFVAIKLHVGEKNNSTHVKPQLIKVLVEKIKAKGAQPFLTETSTLYRGQRENAVAHILLAHRNGFGIDGAGAPFIMSDGLIGNSEAEVEIPGRLHKKVKVAGEVLTTDAFYVVSHPTGHIVTGFGGAIKNLGMGFASRQGKLRQHASLKPEIRTDVCRLCKKCIHWCPENAIVEKDGKLFILADKCIGCGECLAVCSIGAVSFDWDKDPDILQKSMAEHAYGVMKERQDKFFFFNVLVDMTKDCDCFDVDQRKIIKDIGILASSDPVAIDSATLDLTAGISKKTLAELSYPNRDSMIQIRHAAEIGLGFAEYELVE